MMHKGRLVMVDLEVALVDSRRRSPRQALVQTFTRMARQAVLILLDKMEATHTINLNINNRVVKIS